MAHGPPRAPPRASPAPLIARLALPLYLALVASPLIAQWLLATVGAWSEALPWPSIATVFAQAALTLLALTGRIPRRLLLGALASVTLAVLMLSGTLVAAAVGGTVFLASLSVGSRLLRVFDPRGLSTLESSVIAVALGLGVLSHATLALALAGWLLAPLGAAVLAVCLILGYSDLLAAGRGAWHAFRDTDRVSAGPLLVAGSVWAVVLLVGAVAPETEYDSLSYHLGLPRVWIDAGRLVEVPEQIQSWYYLAAEMDFTLAMLLGGVAAAKLLSLGILATAVAAVYAGARWIASQRAAIIAAAIFATTPVIAWQGTTTYVDVTVTLFASLGAFGALRALRSGGVRIAAVSGVLLGLAVATKLTAVLIVVPVFVWLAFATVRAIFSAGPGAAAATALRIPAATGAAALLALAPWPLLRWIQTGNPVFPMLNGIFQSPFLPAADLIYPVFAVDRFGLGKDPLSLLATPFVLTYSALPFVETASGSGFGLSILIAPIALARLRGHPELRGLAFVALTVVAVWAVSVPYARYLLPVFGILSVFAGVALDDLAASPSALTARVASAIPVGLVVATFPLLVLMYPPSAPGIPYSVALGLESRDSYLRRTVTSYAPFRAIAASGGRETNVLLVNVEMGGHIEDRLYAPGRVESIASWRQQDILKLDRAGMLEAIRERGFTHVYLDRDPGDPIVDCSALARPDFFGGEADLIYGKDDVELYQLRDAQRTAAPGPAAPGPARPLADLPCRHGRPGR